MKVKCFCWNCDTEFAVNYQGGDPIKFCPICGEELELDDEDTVVEDVSE